jgi:hypothetical protein
LDTVNSGKKKLTDGTIGVQSMLTLLPVNGESEDEIDCMKGATSRTETATSSNVTTTSVMGGSTNFKDQTKSLAGSKPNGNLTGGHVH